MPIFIVEHATPQMIWSIERTYIEAASSEEANEIFEELEVEYNISPDQIIIEDASNGLDSVYETIEMMPHEVTDEIKSFVAAKAEKMSNIRENASK